MTTSERPVPTPAPAPFPEDAPAPAQLERAAELLAAGQVVGFPTETVYGLAVRADRPEALARLRALKAREPARALTWHVGTRAVLEHFEHLRPLAHRLAERYWPGPLTLVLRGVPAGLDGAAQDGWTGVRLPAHRATAALLAALDIPVVGTSANLSGSAPATTAADVARAFPHGVALVLDGGPSRLAEASGVLRVGPGRFELLREGLLPVADLRRTAGRRIGFVCTGNTCRSPMAEGLARDLLEQRLGLRDDAATARSIADFGFEVRSMGVFAGPGAPPSAHAVEVLAEQGIDIRGHRSSPALPEDVAELEEVYGLTRSHVDALRAAVPPTVAERVQLLDPRGRDVPDPIGGSRSDYAAARDAIRTAIARRAQAWA